MLQDTQSIRYYQRLTDDMVDLWHRGSRFDEIRLYVEGYLACLRDSNSIEPYLIHRLEEEKERGIFRGQERASGHRRIFKQFNRTG